MIRPLLCFSWSVQIASIVAAPSLRVLTDISQLIANVNVTADGAPILIGVPPSTSSISIPPPTNLTAGHDDDEYNVPGTSISLKLVYWPDRDFNRGRLGYYIRQMQMEIKAHIETHGDGPLAHDPYSREADGFYFIASSAPSPLVTKEGQHLTYMSLLKTLSGLFDVMYAWEKPWGAYVMVEDEDLGFLGTAVVLPGRYTSAEDDTSSASSVTTSRRLAKRLQSSTTPSMLTIGSSLSNGTLIVPASSLNLTATAPPSSETTDRPDYPDDLTYHVPGTTTTLQLHFRPDRPIGRNLMGGYFLLMQEEIRAKIAALGPGGSGLPLPAVLDPYTRRGPGMRFSMKGLPGDEAPMMTYRILLDTLVGLFDVMYNGERNQYVYCKIEDGDVRVGTAIVEPLPMRLV